MTATSGDTGQRVEMMNDLLATTSKDFPLVKGVDMQFVGMARSDLRAEAQLDAETITRIEAEAAADLQP